MSTLNIVHNGTQKNSQIGHSYEGKQLHVIAPSLHEEENNVFANPTQGGPGTLFRIDYNLSADDEFNINELRLEFELKNLDGTLTQNIKNPWLLFESVKLLGNNQEIVYYDNGESIYTAQSFYYRKFNNHELKTEMMKLFPTNYSVSTGETIPVSSTTYWSLPLTVLFPFIKNLSRSQGFQRISLEIVAKANTATTGSIGRFMLSSTTNNPYTSSTIQFNNVQLRILYTKHVDPSLRSIPGPIMIIPRYEVRIYTQDFNSNAAQKRIQLSQEYSHHSLCHAFVVYAHDVQSVTAYNDADAVKTDSHPNLIGFNVKYKSRDIIDYTSVNDLNKRVAYLIDVHEKRYEKFNHALIDTSVSSEGQYWIPLTMIDFQSIENNHTSTMEGISGLSNANSEIEIILTNAKSGGTYATAPNIYCVLCYYTIASMDPKTGILTRKNN